VINDADALAKRLGFFEVMRGVKNRRAGRAELRMNSSMFSRACGSMPTVGSSSSRSFWAMQQRATKMDAPLHAAGVGFSPHPSRDPST